MYLFVWSGQRNEVFECRKNVNHDFMVYKIFTLFLFKFHKKHFLKTSKMKYEILWFVKYLHVFFQVSQSDKRCHGFKNRFFFKCHKKHFLKIKTKLKFK